MVFNSFGFFIFFAFVAIVYFILPFRYRRLLLLAAGYYFYMCFKPESVLILAASTLIDYSLARAIDRASSNQKKQKKKNLLILGLVHNLGMLAAFKYLNFFNESVTALLKPFNIFYNSKTIALLVPVGISYYTFKKISYLIDVYRENVKPEKHIGTFALYVSFFPEIVSGPIDRAGKLIPQFNQQSGFDYDRVTAGLKRMAWGFFKKLIIADRLGVFVDKVYNHPTQFEGLSLIAATVYFSFQVYCDFSGYTDIALGAGKVLGFELMENFDRPYFSTSIPTFWKRWHMSLSSWLMDYLFLPIAYAVSRKIKRPVVWAIRAETWAYVTGILTTMILCGLWHGASWTFVLWGAIHGLYLALSFATKKTRRNINKTLGIQKHSLPASVFRTLATFGMVTFAWIFFRANSFSDAGYIVTHLLTGWSNVFDFFHLHGVVQALDFGLLKKELAVALVAIAVVMRVEGWHKDQPFDRWLSSRKTIVRWSFYLFLLVFLLTFGDSGAGNFIYFRF